jgi:hypothetical protein
LAQNNLSFRLVDSESFRNILALETCHRTKISTTVLSALTMEFRNILTESLSGTIAHVGFDLWSSTSHHHYVVSTVHWIDAEWNLQRAACDLLPLSGQAADDIVTAMRKSFEKLRLSESSIASICTDGAANEVAAATWEGFAENAEHVWCIVHQLNLVVGDAYEGRCRARGKEKATNRPAQV